MAEKKNILTRAGLKKLEDELNDLKVNKRSEISKKIGEAREQGDLSENEARIEEIEEILKNAEVVDEDEASTDTVNIGCRVIVHDIHYDEDLEFMIVGSTEANSLNGMISNESPVGHALIGQCVGDVVEVEIGDDVDSYRILEITRNV